MRLASFQSAGATLIPRAVAAFHGRHPKVELGMVEAEPDEAHQLLRAGDIDLALVYDYAVVPGTLDPELETDHLIDDVYDAVVPKDHPLAARSRLAMTDLGDEPWVGPTDRSGCRLIVDRACREAGYDARIAEADETMAAQALVAAGMGVTIYPRLALSPLHPGVPSPGSQLDCWAGSARASPALSSRSRRSRSSSGVGSKRDTSGSASSASSPNSFWNRSVVR